MESEQNTKIVTHNGKFHADDSLACWMLLQTKIGRNAEIVRTRDPAVIAQGDIVVDVGGEYDHEKHRYDHHQRGFNEQFTGHQTKLSGAGLVYRHFGREVIASITGEIADQTLDLMYGRVYANFMEAIDADDNGISRYDGEAKFKSSTSLPSRVNHLSPAWNEPDMDEDAQFMKAVALTGEEFSGCVLRMKNIWLPARSIVEAAFVDRKCVDPSGRILVLESSCPWKEHIFNLEAEANVVGEILYVLYSDKSGQWRIQTVPKALEGFESRLYLPENWRGLRDADLAKASGMADPVFVHISGFIGGAKSKETALKMAQHSVALL